MSEIDVIVPAVEKTSYRIHIGSGTISALWAKLGKDFPQLRKFVVTDSNIVAAGHLKKLLAKDDTPTFVIEPPGEVSKHINTVISIIETMEKAFFGRDTLIVALGGGTVGDIAGFAAAIFKRGINVLQVPTTTISQADSAVGGKTGVDSSVSKNAFGAFYQPAAVHIDVATLLTLDDRQYRSGLVESVKHALIADTEYFKFLEDNIQPLLDRNLDTLEKIAYTNCKIKAAVVAEDPTEKNKRRILNYGHTIGHAVETASSFELLHGEAVAIGIIAAGLIAQKLELADKSQLEHVKNLLKSLNVPLAIPKTITKKQLMEIVKYDKKAVGQCPRFVLLDKIGTVLCRDGSWAHEVDPELIDRTLDELYE
jgi:3-dehydroquinate synthase